MQMQANVNIHNRFDIEVVDSRTGKVRQTATAYNIVLDNMWVTLCNGQQFFTHINFGQGSGTLDPARTSLFSQIASLSATVVETVKALPTSYVKKSITLPLGTYAGKTISELGVYGSRLNTHAMLEDSEGQPITIAVGEFDIVTIYATVYSTFAIENPDDMTLISMPDNNSLVNYLTGGSAPSGSFSVGEGDGDGDPSMTGCSSAPVLGTTSEVSWTADVANKKRSSSSARLAATAGNGHILEVSFANLFRARLPIAGMFEGQSYEGVPLGTGDGETKKFLLPSKNVVDGSLDVYLDGTLTEAYTTRKVLDPSRNYNFVYALGQSAPAGSSAVAMSADGETVAVCRTTQLKVYKNRGVLTAPFAAALPSVTWRRIAFSANGSIMAVVHEGVGDEYVFVYDWDGRVWVKRAASVPVAAIGEGGIALSANGAIMAIAHNTGTERVSTFDWTGSAWAKRDAPATLPGGAGYGIALTPDGKVMAVAHAGGDYVSTYDWTDGAWVKRATPAVKPASTAYAVSLSADGNVMAVAHANGDYVSTYDWTDGAWVKRDAPAQKPLTGDWGNIALNADGSIMLVTYKGGDYFTIYDWTAGAWVARPAPTYNPVGSFSQSRGSMSADGSVVAVGGYNSPYLCVYNLDQTRIEITFNSAPAQGAAITADYTVKGIHKTDQYVIDFSCAIQFGEPEA